MKANNLMEKEGILFKDSKLYTLQLQSKIESIVDLEKFIDDLKIALQIPEEVYANILTCMNEAVINAIVHGNQEDESKKVYINVEASVGKLTFTIKDEGPGFDYSVIPDPTLPENIESTSGRGIYIIEHLADQFIFNSSGNELELQFKY